MSKEFRDSLIRQAKGFHEFKPQRYTDWLKEHPLMPGSDSHHSDDERARFEVWMAKVDDIISDLCEGMTSADLPDIDYWLFWTTGVSPRDTAKKAIYNAGGY